MSKERAAIAQAAATGLRQFAQERPDCPVLVGFDGFVDSIIAVVNKRHDAEHYEPVKTIDQFGKKIQNAAGMSSNYELVVTLEKLGGNGPIMASALASAGLPVTYIGVLGHPAIHSVFQDFAKRAEVHSIGEPGYTDALEFSDGKLLLGKYESLKDLTWARMQDVIGDAPLRAIIHRSALIGMVNWTMLPCMSDIWRQLVKVLAAEGDGQRKQVFIDLADPEKRTSEDLSRALSLCGEFQKHVDLTLGMNLKESSQVAEVLGIKVPPDAADAEGAIEATAGAIRAKLSLYCVVIHPRKGAAASRQRDGKAESASFQGPFVQEPKLSTGAGDNFNAGFCLGNLAGLSLAQSLCAGTATSGYYVRNAASPTLQQLAAFCEKLPAPQ
ncbi:MAG: hypothetical protein WD042_12315 [Phycisphaeraceae bacterium]